jgi:hypothetical protein
MSVKNTIEFSPLGKCQFYEHSFKSSSCALGPVNKKGVPAELKEIDRLC